MTLQNLNATKAAELSLSDEGLANASQNVLPFATGLIGFSAGIITALYGKTTTPERTYGAPPPPEQLPTPTPPSTPTHTGGAPVGG